MNFTHIKKQDTAVFSFSVLVVGLALVLASSILTPAHAQQGSALAAVYGRGVHAYFAGNTSQAEQYFTQAIEGGTTDPRPYYYRAMLRLGQGRTFEAENDMRVGAAYEARNPGVQHAIGRSLQRVQGSGRRTLEKFRRQARLDRLQQSQQRTQQRYEQLDRRGPAVLRSTVPTPLEQPVQPPQIMAVPGVSAPSSSPFAQPAPTVGTPQPAAPATAPPVPAGSGTKEGLSTQAGSGSKSDSDDLFGTPAPVTPAEDPFGESPTPAAAPEPAPAPALTPAPAPVPAEADPFGELPAPGPEPTATNDDPFGESAEPAPAEETPQPEMTEDDPFGSDAVEETPAVEESEAPADADDLDPFGESAEEEPMESDAPAEAEAASDAADDPFGESTESEPADETPAAEDDLFGESTDSESADETPAEEDDPFGDDSMEEESDSSADDSEAPADGEGDAPATESDEDDPFGDF